MSEVEREAILYERAQARLAKAERKELEKKIRELEGGSRPSRGPSASMEKKRKTLEELRARRERRGRKGDSDSDYEEDGEVREKKRRNAGRDEDDSDYFEAETTPKKKNASSLKSMSSIEVIDLAMANELRIPRNALARWMFHPEFDELCRGCLLRLSINSKGEQVYRVVEVKKVVKYHRNYKVNDVITNKAAIMKYGKNEKTFTFDIISNSEFTSAEFERWIGTLKEEAQPIISKKVADGRIKAWRALESTPLSDEIISAMVAAKREIGAAPRNYLAEKTMLSHLRDEAVAAGNQEEVDRIDEELAQINREHSTQTQKTANDSRLEAFAELNRRNRMLNVAAAREAEKSIAKKSGDSDGRLDPFSRRKCQPTNYNMFDQASEDQISKSEAAVKPVVTPQPVETPQTPSQKKPVDLFDVHNVDIDIDI